MPSLWTEHQGMVVLEPMPNTTDTIRVFGYKRPNTLAEVSLTAATIAFVHSSSAADTITDSGTAFVTTGFKSGDRVRVEGGNNDGLELLIVTSVAGILTLHTKELVTTKSVGTSITLSTVIHAEEEFQSIVLSLAAYKLALDEGLEDRVRSSDDKGPTLIQRLRERYLEDQSQVWPGMDYESQTIMVSHRDF